MTDEGAHLIDRDEQALQPGAPGFACCSRFEMESETADHRDHTGPKHQRRIGCRALLRMRCGQEIAGTTEKHKAMETIGRPQSLGGDHPAHFTIGIQGPKDRQNDKRHTRGKENERQPLTFHGALSL
jgi:hypothetical protein